MSTIQLPMAVSHLGWVHGKRNDRGELHPGYDLNFGPTPNADLGRPVVAPVTLRVVETGARKYYGNYVIGVNDAMQYAFRFLHLDKITCSPGQYVSAGTQIGTCGNSSYGGWPGMTAHLHYDILRVPEVRKRKLTWLYWPHAQTPKEVFDAVFVDPASLHPQLLQLLGRK